MAASSRPIRVRDLPDQVVDVFLAQSLLPHPNFGARIHQDALGEELGSLATPDRELLLPPRALGVGDEALGIGGFDGLGAEVVDRILLAHVAEEVLLPASGRTWCGRARAPAAPSPW